jgi:tetratricopeptide (TPR) repeat protein
MERMSSEEPVHVERRLSAEDCLRLCADAREAFLACELDKARELFQKARTHDPFSWKPIQGLGVLAFHEKRHEDAWALLLAAFEAAPDDEDNAENLISIAKQVDRETQALQLLGQAARRFPEASHLEAYRPTPGAEEILATELRGKGEELLGLELWREAFFPFMEALEHAVHDADSWSGLGIAAWRQGFQQVGLEFFRKAVEVRPDSQDAVLNYAESLTRNGQGNQVLGNLLGMCVPKELCAQALDQQSEWRPIKD